MPSNILHKSLNLFLKRQTNILSAAFVIMVTVILSQIFGVIRKRLLISLFGASNILGVYDVASRLPDLIFQLVIAAALSSAFIPVFSGYLEAKQKEEAHQMASSLLTYGLVMFAIISLLLGIFAPFFLTIFNPGAGFSPSDMHLMANLMRVIIFAQFLFIIATFFTALLQSYNIFFIPGIAAAFYNVGIIISILIFAPFLHIFSAALGSIIGALLFIGFQYPAIRKVGFRYRPTLSLQSAGVKKVGYLMGPRTLSTAVMQIGSVVTIALVSFLPSAGRNYVIFDLAQTLAFAPVALIGQAIAQAAFPVLSREKEKLEDFKKTFLTSFSQMLYLILPISVLILVLRIPIVRLIYGAPKLDWPATVLTGRTVAFFALSIFAQALLMLIARCFYALHNTIIPLIINILSTILMIIFATIFIFLYNAGLQNIILPYSLFHGLFRGEFIISFGIEGIAFAFSLANIINLVISLYMLRRKIGKFSSQLFILPFLKIFIATFLTAFALYIPIKLLDQLVFDTTRTINLLILTGISSFAGLVLYLFLTWLFDVREAKTYVQIIGKLGNWRDILGRSDEVIESTKL